MVVRRSLDLIIGWNDTKIEGTELENRVLALLRGAVVERGTESRNKTE